jgi:hypothetical protein
MKLGNVGQVGFRLLFGRRDEFVGERGGVVDFAQGLDDGAGVGEDGAANFIFELEIPGERLNVSVEEDADDFALCVDDRGARVSADAVSGVYGVEDGIEI